MNKINPVEISAKFNELRQNNLHKKFARKEFFNLVRTIGIIPGIAELLIKEGALRKRKVGNQIEIAFTDSPVYKGVFEKVYGKYRAVRREGYYKSRNQEVPVPVSDPIQDAINLLKKEGYSIMKPVGFDEKRFKENNPELYSQYLTYKSV